jgi:hypothetical protein
MGHKFLVAALCCTWAIQLGYLLSLAAKWQRQQSQISARKKPESLTAR